MVLGDNGFRGVGEETHCETFCFIPATALERLFCKEFATLANFWAAAVQLNSAMH